MATTRPAERSTRTLWIIWAGFLLGPVAYVLIAWLIVRGQAARSYPQPLTAVLVLAAAVNVALGVLLPDRILRASRRSSPDEAALRAAYQGAQIVRWAAFEAVAVYGLVLVIVSHQPLPAVAGATIALALIAATRPDLGDAGRRLRQW